MCCSKYSHSRVTNFKLHLKQNNDYTKLIFNEEHLPKHMRLRFPQRLMRFCFIPVCFIACMCLMHSDGVYKEIALGCKQRDACFATCIQSNFPMLNCDQVNYNIEYDGNLYENFFFYPKPPPGRDDSYKECKALIDMNARIPRAGKD